MIFIDHQHLKTIKAWRLKVQTTWALTLMFSLSSCFTSDKYFNLSVFQLPHPSDGDNNGNLSQRVGLRIQGINPEETCKQNLVCGKHPMCVPLIITVVMIKIVIIRSVGNTQVARQVQSHMCLL